MIRKNTEIIPKRRKARKRKTVDGETTDKVQKGGNAKKQLNKTTMRKQANKAVSFSFFITKAEGDEPAIIDALHFMLTCVFSV